MPSKTEILNESVKQALLRGESICVASGDGSHTTIDINPTAQAAVIVKIGPRNDDGRRPVLEMHSIRIDKPGNSLPNS